MPKRFQIQALSPAPFTDLQTMSDEELAEIDGRWVIADEQPGFPCRVSLADAEVGERVLLLPFTHHDTESPYRASGPIYVRPSAEPAEMLPDEVPPILGTRQLSLRAYDSEGMLVAAAVTPGSAARDALRTLIRDAEPSYVHIHNAATGCFVCAATVS